MVAELSKIGKWNRQFYDADPARYSAGFTAGGGNLDTLYNMTRYATHGLRTQVMAMSTNAEEASLRADAHETNIGTARQQIEQLQQTLQNTLTRILHLEAALGSRMASSMDSSRNKRDVTESKPVNGLPMFSGKDTESFKTWATKIAEILAKTQTR